MTPVRKLLPEDVHLWPDGTWCFHYELHEMEHKSDDYETIPVESPAWGELTSDNHASALS